jgi:hypothetical protein
MDRLIKSNHTFEDIVKFAGFFGDILLYKEDQQLVAGILLRVLEHFGRTDQQQHCEIPSDLTNVAETAEELARMISNEIPEEESVDPLTDEISRLAVPGAVIIENMVVPGSSITHGGYTFVRDSNLQQLPSPSPERTLLKKAVYGCGTMISWVLDDLVTAMKINQDSSHSRFADQIVKGVGYFLQSHEFSELPWKTRRHVADRLTDLFLILMHFGTGWLVSNLISKDTLDEEQMKLAGYSLLTMRGLRKDKDRQKIYESSKNSLLRSIQLNKEINQGKPYGFSILVEQWLRDDGEFADNLDKEYKGKWSEEKLDQCKTFGKKLVEKLDFPENFGLPFGVVLASVVGYKITTPVAVFLLTSIGFGTGTKLTTLDVDWFKNATAATSIAFAYLRNFDLLGELPSSEELEILFKPALGPESNDPKLKLLQTRAREMLKNPRPRDHIWIAEFFMNRILYATKPTPAKSKGVYFKAGKNILFNTFGTRSVDEMTMLISMYLTAKDMGMTGQDFEKFLNKS